MEKYCVETTVASDGTLTLRELPFPAGERVEVTVRRREREREGDNRYPLRGTPIRYVGPFESVAEEKWEVLQ